MQRVTSAAVLVDGEVVGSVGTGLLALVGVTHDDGPAQAVALARKLATLRVLRDELAVSDVSGAGILVVSQFTLYGDARKGRRPSWSAAARGAVAAPLIDEVVAELSRTGVTVATGRFGADMRVELINDGPVTLLLEV